MDNQIIILFFAYCRAEAQQLLSYGFENYNGDKETSDYIFTWGDEYDDMHYEASEVISSYNADEMSQTWTPHTGSAFYIQNVSSGVYALSPSVSGITTGHVNAHNNIGYGGDSCYPFDCDGNGSDLKIEDDITTGIIFIRLWARFNKGWDTIENGGRCKWVRVYSNGDQYDTVYMHLQTGPGAWPDSVMHFYCNHEGMWLGTGVSIADVYDGNWHKFSFYVNWNNGTILGWYDITTETLSNYTKSWVAADGAIGGGTAPWYVVLAGNFSGKQPTEETYFALDDVEIWDDIPTGGDTIAPSVSGATINGNSATVTFDEDLDDTAFTNLVNGDLVFTGTTTGAVDLEFCTENAGVVSCTAASSFVNGETVTLSSSGLTGDEICDSSDNCVSSISGESVTNNTIVISDFNDDKSVDGADLAILVSEFGVCSSACSSDVEPDGDVDENDLSIFAAEFGKTES